MVQRVRTLLCGRVCIVGDRVDGGNLGLPLVVAVAAMREGEGGGRVALEKGVFTPHTRIDVEFGGGDPSDLTGCVEPSRATDAGDAEGGRAGGVTGTAQPRVRRDRGGPTMVVDPAIEDAFVELVDWPLEREDELRAAGVVLPRGVLLHGPRGLGKARSVEALCAARGVACLRCDTDALLRTRHPGDAESAILALFDRAARIAAADGRAVVLVPRADVLCPTRREGPAADARAPRVVAAFLTAVDGASALEASVAVIATATDPSAMDPALRRPGRLGREVSVVPPGIEVRRRAIAEALSGYRLRSDTPAESPSGGVAGAGAGAGAGADAIEPAAALPAMASRLAAISAGATMAELAAWPDRAASAAIVRSGGSVDPGDSGATAAAAAEGLTFADFVSTRVGARGATGHAGVTGWDDIGGSAEAKRRLREALEWPIVRAAEARALGVRAARGVLLTGPPGVSKTTLARAAARSAGASFWHGSPAAVYSMYVGEAEKFVRTLFTSARHATPAVIFLDEIDALVGTREGSSAGGGGGGGGDAVKERVLSTLLNEMDGVGAADGVLVIGATNRPDMVDPALRRPGRFEVTVHIPLPDEPSRESILSVIIARGPVPVDRGTVDLAAIAAATDGMSGAELENVVREAALQAMRVAGGNAATVGPEHFAHALRAAGRAVQET